MTDAVMVPLDGSDGDARVLPIAVALADLTDADVHLVRVVDTPVGGVSRRVGLAGVADALGELRESVGRDVAAAAERVAARARHSVASEVLDGADVASVLLAHAARLPAGVIVMATRARGAVARALGGSVADRVMRESPLPVVLVPPGGADYRDKQVHLRRVLVPLDDSPLSLTALDHLLGFRGAGEMEIVLLEVVPRGHVETPRPAVSGVAEAVAAHAAVHLAVPDAPARREAAERRLAAAAERVRARGAIVEAHVVEADDPTEAIGAAVRTSLADIVAMASRGEHGLKRMLLGSVAEGVVRQSDVPVLLVTPARGSAA